MRALILKSVDDPQSLSLVEQALPEPGSDQVRIRFSSMGLNRADLLYCQGRYFFPPIAGSRLGFEGAGYVDKLGTDLSNSHLNVGDRVALLPMSFDIRTQGSFAEYGVYQTEQLIPSPPLLSDEVTGAVWTAYLTAYGGMVQCGALKPGQTVVITAASSSVGLAAIQIAKMIGAQVLAISSDSSKKAALLAQGADEVLIFPANLSDAELDEANQHYVEGVRSFSNVQGSDLVFDAVAGPASYALVKASRQGGCIVFQGMLDRRPMNIHAGVIMKRRLTLRGYTLDGTLENAEQRKAAIEAIQEGFIKTQLRPVIAQQFSLSSFKDAFSELSRDKHIGKMVMTP